MHSCPGHHGDCLESGPHIFQIQGKIRPRVPLFTSPQFHLGGESHLAWQALRGPRESRTAWPSILFPSIYLKDGDGGWVGQPEALGTHAAGKGLGLNISLKMVENCNSGPHLECRVPQFPDFIVLNFDCRWLSEERTSGEHLSMESRKRDGEGPAHFPGL